jgi:hypothetical protein
MKKIGRRSASKAPSKMDELKESSLVVPEELRGRG